MEEAQSGGGTAVRTVEPAAPQAERAIRVFVSSTFRDMKADRDYLVRHVFPRLRRLCERRGVSWADVDLRWGVTDEQAAEGKVLPICLAEIDRCRPFFIGLLGERYGWVPEAVPPELAEAHPWLAEASGRSVTELEIEHGAFAGAEQPPRAFFYLRDPSYLERPEAAPRSDFDEAATDTPGAEQRTERLELLKQRIEASEHPVRAGYRDPAHLGELLLEDLEGMIDELFPPDEGADPFLAERVQHEALARSRSAVYVERPAYFEALDGFAAGPGDDRAFSVLGPSGFGKSSLLASWARRHRELHPEDATIMHFVGCSQLSADPDLMLQRLIGELASAAGLEPEGELTDSAAIREEFARLLAAAGAERRVVLVIDALNQLEERPGAHELAWLPPEIPDGVRLVVSTLPGAAEDSLRRLGWSERSLTVAGLAPEERRKLIELYLEHHAKQLDPRRAERIAAHPGSANPLYLRALLDELRIWGAHETLDARIGELLGAESVAELFDTILARFESDYEGEHPGLVGTALSLLWASRSGLADAALLDLLGADGEPLPQATWAPIHHAAADLLIDRGGLLDLNHSFVAEAVEARYLATDETRRDAHLRIADYMVGRGPGGQALAEAPWQLARAGAWQRLADLLGETEWLPAMVGERSEDLRSLWTEIEAESEIRAADVYAVELGPEPSAAELEHAICAAELLSSRDELVAAEPILEALVERLGSDGDPDQLERALFELAAIRDTHHGPEAAMPLVERAEELCRRVGDEAGLLRTLGLRAGLLDREGEREQAMALLGEQEEICERIGHRRGLAGAIRRRGAILEREGEIEEAMALFQRAERIAREHGDLDGIATALGVRAAALAGAGEAARALELLDEQEDIFRRLGSRMGIQRALGQRASLLSSRGELEAAWDLLVEKERICREIRHLAGLQEAAGAKGQICRAMGELDRALGFHQEAAEIARQLRDLGGYAAALGNQAAVHATRGEKGAALELTSQQQQIYTETRDLAGLGWALGARAAMIGDDDPQGAMELLEQQEKIFRHLNDPANLATSLGDQAVLVAHAGDFRRALEIHGEEEALRRRINDRSGLALSLSNQALWLIRLDHLEGAAKLLAEQEALARETAEPEVLARGLNLQGIVLVNQGQTAAAELKLAEALDLAERAGDPELAQTVRSNFPPADGEHVVAFCPSCGLYRIFRKRSLRGLRCSSCGSALG